PGGELLRHARMRAASPPALPHPQRRPARPLRRHRGVLQHAPSAFGPRLFVTRSLREEVDPFSARHLVAWCPPNWGNSRPIAILDRSLRGEEGQPSERELRGMVKTLK